ncbi:transcription termination factor 1, mitochondrial [Hyla sarda]|uniref:transcription termination factor 1, mitochondrial n=1 Tax=Hyla sarda TaxID=327740 RepID=UPI0024C40E3B|nr:transcription termination factor 1, mitochondrial [Hyla sarda]XP_056375025.1 transcription termination factor 1, mitochondrial [Hyla sarda]XP_056375026.1 transcription termination factor 1, mitochondrial [Hyla sarda]XP_056375027.1 transcription termination factor 1, mitochondrial [Hyla sarda]
MALKMLINITGNFVTCMKSTRNGKAVASFTITIPGIAWARFCTQQLSHNEVKIPVENLNLVTNLEQMGVDMTKIRMRNAILLKKTITYEQKLKQFLTDKGADTKMVASIISRYPRAITRKHEVLDEMWNIWKGILDTDTTVLSVAQRSPESFFRTSNTENLLKNIRYLQSLGLPPKILSQLMVKSPRTFANSVDLNKQNVEYLLGLCSQLGGKNPREFVRELISRNIYILTKSTNRIQANVENMKSLMKLDDCTLLRWIQGDGSPLLSLSYTYFENNYKSVQEILQSLGCTESQVSLFIFMCPKVLLMTPNIFANKVNVLLECGIDVREILDTSNILAVHINSLKSRIMMLKDCGYDFRLYGLSVLSLSQAKFISKLERLRSAGSPDENVGHC